MEEDLQTELNEFSLQKHSSHSRHQSLKAPFINETPSHLGGHVDVFDQGRVLSRAVLQVVEQAPVAHELRHNVNRLRGYLQHSKLTSSEATITIQVRALS